MVNIFTSRTIPERINYWTIAIPLFDGGSEVCTASWPLTQHRQTPDTAAASTPAPTQQSFPGHPRQAFEGLPTEINIHNDFNLHASIVLLLIIQSVPTQASFGCSGAGERHHTWFTWGGRGRPGKGGTISPLSTNYRHIIPPLPCVKERKPPSPSSE